MGLWDYAPHVDCPDLIRQEAALRGSADILGSEIHESILETGAGLQIPPVVGSGDVRRSLFVDGDRF